MRELCEADFHKPGIYGSGRIWADAWDMVCPSPSRGGSGRPAAVDFVVCFGCGGISFFFSCFFSSNAHDQAPAASMRPPCLIYLSTSVCSIIGTAYFVLILNFLPHILQVEAACISETQTTVYLVYRFKYCTCRLNFPRGQRRHTYRILDTFIKSSKYFSCFVWTLLINL